MVQWGGSDVYKVGGKVFAVCGFGDGLAFKVSEIGFVVLTEDGGPGRQAPYFAKGHWVVVDLDDADIEDAAGWLATVAQPDRGQAHEGGAGGAGPLALPRRPCRNRGWRWPPASCAGARAAGRWRRGSRP